MKTEFSRQLPTSSTLPGFPTVPTLPVTQEIETGYPSPSSQAPTLVNIGYTQAYLRTQIGKRVRIEFLIGSNSMTDRSGIIVEVGISYIVIQDTNTGDLILCDLYAIKFVTFFD